MLIFIDFSIQQTNTPEIFMRTLLAFRRSSSQHYWKIAALLAREDHLGCMVEVLGMYPKLSKPPPIATFCNEPTGIFR